MNAREIIERLKAPFPAEAISWRVGSTDKEKTRGLALAYIDSRDVQDRLDDVVGAENWRDEYQEVAGFLICKLWIRIDGEWNWKCDGAGKTDVEAEKGMVSDSFKRSAVKWGIGRYLYNLDSPWVSINDRRQIDKSEYPRLRALLGGKAESAPKVNAVNSAATVAAASHAGAQQAASARQIAQAAIAKAKEPVPPLPTDRRISEKAAAYGRAQAAARKPETQQQTRKQYVSSAQAHKSAETLTELLAEMHSQPQDREKVLTWGRSKKTQDRFGLLSEGDRHLFVHEYETLWKSLGGTVKESVA